MASVFFCQRLGDDLRLDLLFDVHLAQPRILRLKLFHLRHQRHVHAAVLAAPVVERCRADAQLAADLRHGNARLRPLERFHDLAVCELRLLHCVELPLLEILLLISLTERADYPGSSMIGTCPMERMADLDERAMPPRDRARNHAAWPVSAIEIRAETPK